MNNKINPGTIARTVVLVVALANQSLAMAGKTALPFTIDQVYQAVTGIFTVGAALVAWWKNNSFTLQAIKADETLKTLKENTK